jgi:hypothetical protein
MNSSELSKSNMLNILSAIGLSRDVRQLVRDGEYNLVDLENAYSLAKVSGNSKNMEILQKQIREIKKKFL